MHISLVYVASNKHVCDKEEAYTVCLEQATVSTLPVQVRWMLIVKVVVSECDVEEVMSSLSVNVLLFCLSTDATPLNAWHILT